MKKGIFLIIVALATTGCSAKMVKDPRVNDIPSDYAPINKPQNNYGVVSYLDEGASFVREARRKDAFKKMFNSCNGKYQIISEGSGETNPMYAVQGGLLFSATSTYVNFTFECVE